MNSYQPMLRGSQGLAPQHEGLLLLQQYITPYPEVPAPLRASKGAPQAQTAKP